MLQLNIQTSDGFNEETQTFVTETWTLKLEHSLVSFSKWESKYRKPFLTNDTKTEDEILDYIKMMDLSEETPPEIFQKFSNDDYNAINKYINDKQTATWFNRTTKPRPSRQKITSELIYYWLTAYEIPWEAQTWHLNRLFTLIEVFSEERASQDKKRPNRTNQESIAEERRRVNAQRKKELNTSG